MNRLEDTSRAHPKIEVPDPRPLLRRPGLWRTAAQMSSVGLLILAFIVSLDLARPLLVPVVSAIVIGTMLGPLSRRAARHKIPAWLFATLTLLLIIALFQALTVLVSRPIAEGVAKAPEYGAQFAEKFDALTTSVPALSRLRNWVATGDVKFDAGYLQPVVAFVTPALGQLVVFFATLFFFLLERTEIRRDLVLVFRQQDDRLRALRVLNDIEANLTRYIGTVTAINLALGVGVGAGAYLFGLPSPVLLGALAFVANYLPYIGPAFVTLTLFVVGLTTFPTLGDAAVPPALFVALATVEGHFITPNIIGKRLTLNPLAVFLCLSFWTWLWGPVGAFLSVPFLIVALVALNHLVFKPEVELPD